MHKIFFFIASALPSVHVLKTDADCRQMDADVRRILSDH